MEANSTKETAKKIWHIVRAVFFMLRKAISKSKIMVDLNLLLKRSNKLAGKAINNLITFNHSNHHVYSSITCRSDDILSSFVSPQYVREYEFSCSNSPAFKYFNHHHHKRNKHYNYLHRKAKTYKYDDVSTVAAVQKVLEMLNSEVAAVESSPAVMGLPGLGKSPIVRQLRVTDSPFSLKDEEGDGGQVDKAAEEFINKFYKDLKKQKFSTSVFESPYYELMRAR